MAEVQGSSFWRWARRIVLVVFALVGLAIVALVLYLRSLPVPSAEKIAVADQRYRRVRELFKHSDYQSTQTLAAAPLSNTDDATKSLQARCDLLFTQLVQIKFDPYSGVTYPKITQADLDNAKALAALYDLGVRVSPAAQRDYRLGTQGRLIMFLAQTMVLEIKPTDGRREIYAKTVNKINFMDPAERSQRFARYVESLKFLRVANCPTSRLGTGIGLSEDEYLRTTLPGKTGSTPTPLPPEMANFNVELLAPREPLDWDRFLALELDWRRDDCVGAEKLTHMNNAFRFFKNQIEADTPESWYKPLITNLGGTTGAIIFPRKVFAPSLESDLQMEQQIENYAQGYKTNSLTPSIVAQAQILNFHNEQIMSRLEAAGIELRQGKPLPSPDAIGPNSYYFDPVTQRPYLMRIENTDPGYVNLSICRPIQQSAIIKNGKQIKVEGRATSILHVANRLGSRKRRPG